MPLYLNVYLIAHTDDWTIEKECYYDFIIWQKR